MPLNILRRFLLAGISAGLLLIHGQLSAALSFPSLTGRVVDNAELLDQATIGKITQLLAQHEQQTSNQVVVVTLKSLQGDSIEDFGYQLGRHWGIGQKGKDNGVLLIVAPKERKVRIEVGYGLEGKLTDAYSSVIINEFILPQFKQGHYAQGILVGVQKILGVLQGTYKPEARKRKKTNLFVIFFNLIIILIFGLTFFGGRGRGGPGGFIGGGSYGSGGSYSGGGGSFSGGGGSFGGGGASGGW